MDKFAAVMWDNVPNNDAMLYASPNQGKGKFGKHTYRITAQMEKKQNEERNVSTNVRPDFVTKEYGMLWGDTETVTTCILHVLH